MTLSIDNIADNLYKNMKRIRSIANISIKELSEYLDFPRKIINNFENGRVLRCIRV